MITRRLLTMLASIGLASLSPTITSAQSRSDSVAVVKALAQFVREKNAGSVSVGSALLCVSHDCRPHESTASATISLLAQELNAPISPRESPRLTKYRLRISEPQFVAADTARILLQYEFAGPRRGPNGAESLGLRDVELLVLRASSGWHVIGESVARLS